MCDYVCVCVCVCVCVRVCVCVFNYFINHVEVTDRDVRIRMFFSEPIFYHPLVLNEHRQPNV